MMPDDLILPPRSRCAWKPAKLLPVFLMSERVIAFVAAVHSLSAQTTGHTVSSSGFALSPETQIALITDAPWPSP
jgi:hypothetical protein